MTAGVHLVISTAYQEPTVTFADLSSAQLFALDLLAIAVLTFGLYFPRHRRRELVVAYLVINVGVLAVTLALASATVGTGVGLGLFGVLSILRLRSSALEQAEVAYYFAALALGLLGGFGLSPSWLSPVLMGTIVAAVFVGDHPRLFSGYRTGVLTLDRAFTDEVALRCHLESLLGARVHRMHLRKVDLVNDTTVVEVRYQLPREPVTPPSTTAAAYHRAEFEVGS